MKFRLKPGHSERERRDDQRRTGLTPGGRTVAAILGMWLGSLTLAFSFAQGAGQGISREEVAALLKALAQIVELEEEDLRRHPTYPGGPVDPVPHQQPR